ncbi:MAG: hypothetical protein R3D03_18600 [Geminicoccaceae bacterium]|nr:hypothetical protein [Geminicoccaceae bacterium]
MSDRKVQENDRQWWLDQPGNVNKIVYALVSICVLLFFADALYQKHGYFGIEHFFGFYGVYGFVVCVGLVLVAKWMRLILMRPEDYYDPDE